MDTFIQINNDEEYNYYINNSEYINDEQKKFLINTNNLLDRQNIYPSLNLFDLQQQMLICFQRDYGYIYIIGKNHLYKKIIYINDIYEKLCIYMFVIGYTNHNKLFCYIKMSDRNYICGSKQIMNNQIIRFRTIEDRIKLMEPFYNKFMEHDLMIKNIIISEDVKEKIFDIYNNNNIVNIILLEIFGHIPKTYKYNFID